MNKVYLQYWEESERGWGVRPDGCSLHLDLNNHKSYLDRIYSGRDSKNVPYEYDRVVGDPIEVEVSDSIFNQVKITGDTRLSQSSLANCRNFKDIKNIFEDECIS